MISQNLSSLNGKTVKDFDVTTGLGDPNNTVYRIRVNYDSSTTAADLINRLASSPDAPWVEELIIGAFDFDGGDSQPVVDALISNAAKLTKLRVLFIGDITYEENEVSWINQVNMGPLLKAYPDLEYFRVRGGNGLNFGGSLQHENLTHLIIESGGLPPVVINEVSAAKLPNLEHLELWLGDDSYGFDSTPEDFTTIIQGNSFPKLVYLGLRDAKISDDLAKMVSKSPIMDRLEVLDFSKGTIGDEGANALLAAPGLRKLKELNLKHHYISDAVAQKFRGLGVVVNLDDKKDEEDGDRYVEVAE
jgi:Leucine Rich repeat